LNSWRQHWSVQASNVRRFIISGDFAEFTAKRAPDVPYPDARSLASVLQDPFIRRILPASVRQPVPIVPRVLTGDAFVADGTYRSTPRDPSLRAWGSFGPAGDSGRGRLESDAIDGCQSAATLQFSVAGYLGWPRLSLVVKDLHSGREWKVLPGRVALEAWTSALVPCPPGPFVVIATDERADVWFAFREPVEVGRVSPWVERLIGSSFELLVLSLAVGVLAVRWTSPYESQLATRS
jgi:hypothetical protein